MKHEISERGMEMLLSAVSQSFTPIEVAIAIALYGYNVSAVERATKIYEHFDGNCAEIDKLVCYMMNYGSAPTAMPFPSAEVYVRHALEKYGDEAKHRVNVEREGQVIVEQMKGRANRNV